MDQEMKKTAPATTPAPLDDAALEDVSGGADTIPLPNGAIPGICPNCGGMLRKESSVLRCDSCRYWQVR